MKNKLLLALPLFCLLTGCDFPNGFTPPNGPIESVSEHVPGGEISDDVKGGEEISIIVDDSEEKDIKDNEEINSITDLNVNGISYDESKKLFTISSAGEFVFTGSFNGNILVDAGDEDEVKVTLSGFSIKSSSDSPIKCVNASEFQLSLKKGTENFVYDYRSVKEEDDDNQGNGAITSDCDMKLSGKGSLVVEAKYNNGIHCKDDLKLKPEVNEDSSIQILAVNNAIKGNDSVTVESGNYVLISTSGNGIITENSDLSSKGKQRGTIAISGGQIDIYSCKDGIDAAYNVEISNEPIINIYTSKYSSYTSGSVTTDSTKFYLAIPKNIDLNSVYFAVEFLSSDYYTSWVKATSISSSGGGSRDYKYLSLDRPSKATSFKVCSFKSSVTEMSEDNASALMSGYQTINSSYDTAKVSINGSNIRLDGWSNFNSNQGHGGPGGPGGQSEGNTDKSEVSAKGIKADNIINISGGKFFLKTYDDGIHANYGTALENDSTGVGDVIISGGTFSIYAADDGIHADHSLEISGGTIDIEYSYEGIEGNLITFSGGYTKVYSTDDAVNASNKSGVTPTINVTDGILDVTVYGQDVDGIDSNGSFTQSGGKVITKGGNSQMSTGLDCDGYASITGGTFISFGRTEKTPSKGSSISSYSLNGSYGIGSYKITYPDESSVTVSTKYSYSAVYVYSDSSTQITISKI